MKTLLLTIRQYLNGIDKGKRATRMKYGPEIETH